MSTLAHDDRTLLLDAVHDFARHELLPAAPLLDAGPDGRRWAQICELGLDRAPLAEDAGGGGLPPGDWLALIEELAAAEGGLALAVALHAVALSPLPVEEAAAVPHGSRWSVVWAPGALALGAAGADGVVLIGAAPAVARRWSAVPDPSQMGLRAAPAARVHVEESEPLAADADALTALLFGATAAVALGIARRAHALAVDYAAARQQGGGPIGRYGAVRELLARMAAHLHARPRLPFEDDAPPLPVALAAKAVAGAIAGATTIDAVQVLGGSGYVRDSGAEKLMRDAKYCELYPEPGWRCRQRLIALDTRLPAPGT